RTSRSTTSRSAARRPTSNSRAGPRAASTTCSEASRGSSPRKPHDVGNEPACKPVSSRPVRKCPAHLIGGRGTFCVSGGPVLLPLRSARRVVVPALVGGAVAVPALGQGFGGRCAGWLERSGEVVVRLGV